MSLILTDGLFLLQQVKYIYADTNTHLYMHFIYAYICVWTACIYSSNKMQKGNNILIHRHFYYGKQLKLSHFEITASFVR